MKGEGIMSTSNQDEMYYKRLKERYREAKLVRKIVFVVLFALIIAIVAIGIASYLYIKSALEPVDPNDESVKNVEIPLGSSVATIAEILEKNDIIVNATVFRYYTKFKNESDFQAGNYELSPSMTLDEIIAALKTGKVIEEAVFTVTIPEGKTVEEIASIFANQTNITKEEFLEKVNDETYIRQLMEIYPTILTEEILKPGIKTPLEGYLFAATYDFYTEDPSVDTIVQTMLDKTEEVVLNYIDQIKAFELEDLTVHEALTMASLVENEARSIEHRKKIAGVFYNRLEEGMPLQTDPTVAYAHGKHLERTYYVDTEIDSPYNTYKYAGLPIGPISNFAENSLQAILEPEQTSYFYFLASDEGEIYYSETLEEHNALKAKYINNKD
jgi:UPF0755 protein